MIGAADCPVKVGIAERPNLRLSELQVGCPDELFIHHLIRVPWGLAAEIEREAHAALDQFHRRGEWFNVHKDEAAKVVIRLKEDGLSAWRFQAHGTGDWLLKLSAECEVSPDARRAVANYWSALDAGDKRYTGLANGYVQRHAGDVAYAAFSVAVVQRKNVALQGDLLARANAALARALNALVEFGPEYHLALGSVENGWSELYKKRALKRAR